MSMKLKVCPESDFLRVDAVGEFSLAEAKRTFLEMLEAVARHKVGKVLFDGRGLAGEPKTIERFFYGKFAARAVAEFADRGMLSRSTQFGYVLEEPVRDKRSGRNRRRELWHVCQDLRQSARRSRMARNIACQQAGCR